MKASSLKRGAPMKRTRMQRGKAGLRRTRMKRVGKRALREADQLAAFRANPPVRCERCLKRRNVEAHHVLPRSRGGPHTTDNRHWLCFLCHSGVHDHTATDWKEWTR